MAEDLDINDISLTQVGPFSQEEDTTIDLAQTDLKPTDAAFEVSIGRSEIEKNAVEDWRKSFDLKDLNKKAFEANMNNRQILDYAVRNFPGTIDIEGLRSKGFDDANLLSMLLGYRSEMGVEAIGKGTQLGMVEAAPPLAGGVAAGMTATGVTGNPLVGLITGIATGLVLTPTGQNIKNFLFSDAPFTPDAYAFGESGRTIGMGSLSFYAPHYAARKFSPGSATVSNNIDYLARSKNPLAPIIETYAKRPLGSTYLETTSILGAATGAYQAERSFPGEELPRFVGETVGGVFSPVRLVTRLTEAAGKGLMNTIRKYALPDGQQSNQGTRLIEYITKNGGDPKKVLEALQSYEKGELGIQTLAKDLGVDLKPIKTVDEETGKETFTKTMSLLQITDDPAIKKLFQTMLQEKEFGPTIAGAIDQDYVTLGALIDIMQKTGDPALLEKAALMKEDLMRGVITRLLDKKNTRAKNTVNQLIKRNDTFLSAKSSVALEQLTQQALSAARKQEKELYALVNGDEPFNLDNFLTKLAENEEKLLPGEIDFLPVAIRNLVLRAKGVTGDDAVTFDNALDSLQKKIAKGNEKISEINAIYPNDVAFVNRIIEDGDYSGFLSATEAKVAITDKKIRTLFNVEEGETLDLVTVISERKDLPIQNTRSDGPIYEMIEDFKDNTQYSIRRDMTDEEKGKQLFLDAYLSTAERGLLKIPIFEELMPALKSRLEAGSRAVNFTTSDPSVLIERAKNPNTYLSNSFYNAQSIKELTETINVLKREIPKEIELIYSQQSVRKKGKADGIKKSSLGQAQSYFNQQIKGLEDLLKFKNKYKEIFDDDLLLKNTKFLRDEEIRDLQIRDTENFDKLPQDEKLRVKLEEIQKHIAGMEKPSAVEMLRGQRLDNFFNILEKETRLDFSRIRRNRVLNLLKEKAKILNNELNLINARNKFTAQTTDAVPEEITIKDGMRARSILLTLMKQKTALGSSQDLNQARILGELADSIKDDFGIKVGGDAPDGKALAALSDDQKKLRNAFIFSKALNDVFTRAFPNSMVAKDRLGGMFNIPELAHKKIFTGGGDSTALKYDQLQKAMTFLADNVAGENFNEFTIAQVGSLRAAQTDLLRVAAKKTIDSNTGRVNAASLNRFKEEFKPVLFNEDGTEKFPEFMRDIETVEKAQNAFDTLIGKTGDPKILETGISPLGKGIPSQGVYQKKLKNTINLSSFLDGNATEIVKSTVGEPGNRKTGSEQALRNLIKQSFRAENKFSGAANGLKDLIFEQAYYYATGKADKGGKQFTNFAQMQDYLVSPFEGRGPSILEIMRQEGLVTNAEAIRFNSLLNDSVGIQKGFMGSDNLELRQASGAPLPKELGGEILRKIVRLFGLSAGGKVTEFIPGRSQGLAEPIIVADEIDQRLFQVPSEALKDLLLEAVTNPSAFKLFMEKGITRQDRIKLPKALNSFLFSSGLISAQSYKDFIEKKEEEKRNVVVPVDPPQVIGRETKPVAPALVRSQDIIQTSQAPAPAPAPTTNIASVSPSLNNIAPPAQNQSVDRRRFAALFPEDRALIEGIGSLRG
jgi:hypothetical protein